MPINSFCLISFFTVIDRLCQLTARWQYYSKYLISDQIVINGRRQSIVVMDVGSVAPVGDDLRRPSGDFTDNPRQQEHPRDSSDQRTLPNHKEDMDDSSERTKVNEWRLDAQVKDIQSNDPAEGRSLGVTWKDLTVRVLPSDAILQENVLSQFNAIRQARESRNKSSLKTILEKSSGCVKPGEMLLVLGRPGSGCTTLLKLLSNRRKG